MKRFVIILLILFPSKILLILILVSIFLLNSCNDLILRDNDPLIKTYQKIDHSPAWSPDGMYIAYIHYGDSCTYGLYTIDTNGLINKLLTASYSELEHPNWSPDSKWIVFEYNRQIHKIKSQGDSLTQLTNFASNFHPSFSPDGELICFDSDSQDTSSTLTYIWKMKNDGTNISRVSNVIASKPFWGNNGYIIHLRWCSVNKPEDLCIMDQYGNSFRRITDNNVFEIYPRISLDGNKILFSCQSESGVYFHLFTINFDGSNFHQIISSQVYSADWSPDGNKIVYCNADLDNGFLWIMNKDGSNKKQITF